MAWKCTHDKHINAKLSVLVHAEKIKCIEIVNVSCQVMILGLIYWNDAGSETKTQTDWHVSLI